MGGRREGKWTRRRRRDCPPVMPGERLREACGVQGGRGAGNGSPPENRLLGGEIFKDDLENEDGFGDLFDVVRGLDPGGEVEKRACWPSLDVMTVRIPAGACHCDHSGW